jgi:hypothetical protein
MSNKLHRALILSMAAVLLAGAAAWAEEESERVWVTAEGDAMALHAHDRAVFISEDGEVFDLGDLAEGETRTFGEGAKQVTATRLGEIVTINREANGDERKLEIKCDVAQDTCQVMTFEDDPEKVMVVVKKTRNCIDGAGDCEATVDVMLDKADLGEGTHAIVRKIRCDDHGDCEHFEDVHQGGELEVVADFHDGGHGNVMIFHAGDPDGKVTLSCPEGDSTVTVEPDEADDVFLCPKHSIAMEQAPAKKLIRKILVKEE